MLDLTVGDVPNPNLAVATGGRHAIALRRERDGADIDAGAIQFLRCLAGRSVDDFQSSSLKPTTASCWLFGCMLTAAIAVFARRDVKRVSCARCPTGRAVVGRARGEHRAVVRQDHRVNPIFVRFQFGLEFAVRAHPKWTRDGRRSRPRSSWPSGVIATPVTTVGRSSWTCAALNDARRFDDVRLSGAAIVAQPSTIAQPRTESTNRVRCC